MRRLPVYLLLDCSGSMAGRPIEAVRQSVKAFLADLRSDSQALETASVSIITYAATAQQLMDLMELQRVPQPSLEARGSSALGAALALLERAIRREVLSQERCNGLWRPLVFLMTDGRPTDDWESAADSLKRLSVGPIVALAAGPSPDLNLLHRLTDRVLELDTLQPECLKEYFQWVSVQA